MKKGKTHNKQFLTAWAEYNREIDKHNKREKSRIRTAIASYLIFFISGIVGAYYRTNTGQVFIYATFLLCLIITLIFNIYTLSKNIEKGVYKKASRAFQWIDVCFIFFSTSMIYTLLSNK